MVVGPRRALVAGALVLAGVYQFTPIKTRCLTVCRSPFGLVARRWRGAAPTSESLLLGSGVRDVVCRMLLDAHARDVRRRRRELSL